MDKTAEQLNEEFKAINIAMRELNGRRYEIYQEWSKLTDPEKPIELKEMRTVSMYHDLYLNDVDKD